MKFDLYDILHILGDFQLVVLTAVLLRKSVNNISNRFLSIFFLAQIIVSLSSIWNANFEYSAEHYPYLGFIYPPVIFIWGPTMYFFIQSETKPQFKFQFKHFLHYFPSILIGLYLIFSFHIYPIDMKREFLRSGSVLSFSSQLLLGKIMIVQVLIYNTFAAIRLEKFAKKKQQLNVAELNRLKWDRFILYGYFISCTIYNLTEIFPDSFGNWEVRSFFTFLVFTVYYTTLLYKAISSSHFASKRDEPKSRVLSLGKTEAKKLIDKIEEYMVTKRPYIQSGFTLEQLAEAIDTKDRYVSQVINEFRQQNFSDFVNSYRIEEAKLRLQDTSDPKKTILEVVFEVGFNSKTAFNAGFKKYTGVTPTEFKRTHKSS